MILKPRNKNGVFEERTREQAVAVFWSRVDKNGPIPAHRPELGPCWLWNGPKLSKKRNYGKTWWNGKTVFAHIVSYTLERGPIPKGLEPDHLCFNPQCVRPEHIEPVMHSENILRSTTYTRFGKCKNGHQVTEDNLYVSRKTGIRRCKLCCKIRDYSYAEKKALEPEGEEE
jgi:hypothetical protein